jgi:hypothetical protein
MIILASCGPWGFGKLGSMKPWPVGNVIVIGSNSYCRIVLVDFWLEMACYFELGIFKVLMHTCILQFFLRLVFDGI